MKVLITIAFALIVAAPAAAQSWSRCLPTDMKADEPLRVTSVTDRRGVTRNETFTVAQELKRLGAKCSNGLLVDHGRREIRFYSYKTCWGTPPRNYREITARQRQELADLRKKYTVIELTCNRTGTMPS